MKLSPSLILFLGTFLGFGMGFFIGLWLGNTAMEEQISTIRIKNPNSHISGYIIIVPISYCLISATLGGLVGAGFSTILNRTLLTPYPTGERK